MRKDFALKAGTFMTQPFETVNVLGFDFINTTQTNFIEQLKQDCLNHQNRFIVTANPEIVLAAKNDAHYAQIIQTADYLTADGIGIVKGAKILGTPLPERVTGYDTMMALLAWCHEQHKKVFFVGAKPQVIQAVKAKIKTEYPGIAIAGAFDGYFKDDQPIVQAIAQSQPDFVFCALGFPKQEYFINKNRTVASAIWMGVGGAFDVLAGTAKRAPKWWIDHHVEWLYRLLKEPSRFGRMLALPKYLLLVYQSKFNH